MDTKQNDAIKTTVRGALKQIEGLATEFHLQWEAGNISERKLLEQMTVMISILMTARTQLTHYREDK